MEKVASASGWGRARGGLACWWGKGPPRRRSVAGLRGLSSTLGLRHGPDSYGMQQWGILDNGGNPDPAMPRAGRRPSGCKPLLAGKKSLRITPVGVDGTGGIAPANYVPAAAVIRRVRALIGITGRKACAGGSLCRW